MRRQNDFRLFTIRVQFLVVAYAAVACSRSDGQIYFDDFTDDEQPYEYRLVESPCCPPLPIDSEMSMEEDGLVFFAKSPTGIEIQTDDGPLPNSVSWSIRAELTVDETVGDLGFAGVGITGPERFAGIFARSRQYAVGQSFAPDTAEIEDNGISDPFVVQMNFNGETLSGHFWRPETPTTVTTIEYGVSPSSNPGPPRLANNGSQATYRAIWLSNTMLPLPTGFEGAGDLDGNEVIEFGDIDLLAEQIRGDQQPDFDLNADGVVDLDDQRVLIEEYLGTQPGDADLDGMVAFSDFLALSASFGGAGGWAAGDFDASGDVTFSDFLILSNNFASETLATAVPEPSGFYVSTAIICVLVTASRRPRRKLEADSV